MRNISLEDAMDKVRLWEQALDHVTEMTNPNASEPVVTVRIGGISKDVLVDSGSASNLISQDELKNLQSQGLKIELQLCSKKLYAYSI